MTTHTGTDGVPYLFTFDEMMPALAMLPTGTRWTSDQALTAMVRVGRNYAPDVLSDLHLHGVIGDDVLAELIGTVWSMAEYPMRCLYPEDWLELFNAAGYTETDPSGGSQRARRPSEPLTLFRGATPEHALGWSWTDSVEVAERFASGQLLGRGAGQVWIATVPPGHMLARIDGRNESEYVVDPDGLAVRAA